MQVDAVEQRPRDLGLIVGGAARRPRAGQRRIAEMPAPARVHRGDELDPRREGHMRIGAGNADHPRLERLAQRIEHGALEFGKLVENSTPRWARLTSPGLTRSPPPVSAAIEAL